MITSATETMGRRFSNPTGFQLRQTGFNGNRPPAGVAKLAGRGGPGNVPEESEV
ncbi:hypothetical protein, partial [Pseudomonas phage vB_Pae_BR144a]